MKIFDLRTNAIFNIIKRLLLKTQIIAILIKQYMKVSMNPRKVYGTLFQTCFSAKRASTKILCYMDSGVGITVLFLYAKKMCLSGRNNIINLGFI